MEEGDETPPLKGHLCQGGGPSCFAKEGRKHAIFQVDTQDLGGNVHRGAGSRVCGAEDSCLKQGRFYPPLNKQIVTSSAKLPDAATKASSFSLVGRYSVTVGTDDVWLTLARQ